MTKLSHSSELAKVCSVILLLLMLWDVVDTLSISIIYSIIIRYRISASPLLLSVHESSLCYS